MRELPAGLLEWARMPGPAVVLDAVRLRAQRGFRIESGPVRVDLTPAQRREVARLLGTPWDVSGKPVRLEYLAAALAEHGLSTQEFLETLDGGPLVNRKLQRAAERAAAEQERSTAAALLAGRGVPEACVRSWLADPSLPRPGTGELECLADQVAQVWQRLPARAGTPVGTLVGTPVGTPGETSVRLARLAATTFDDAHALDYSQPLGRAVSRLIALVHRCPRPRGPGRDWRAAWAAAGVRCDRVSSRVLVLNVPLAGSAAAARLCAAAPGEPLWLSLRALDGEWSPTASTRVFVCENPTVVEAAADELGPRCPPLICTEGLASLAALELLAGLAAAGAGFSVRADVDEAGFIVVDQVLSVTERTALWRYDAATYAAYLASPAQPRADPSARGRLRQLRELYAQHQVALHEEALLDDLLSDLACDVPEVRA